MDFYCRLAVRAKVDYDDLDPNPPSNGFLYCRLAVRAKVDYVDLDPNPSITFLFDRF